MRIATTVALLITLAPAAAVAQSLDIPSGTYAVDKTHASVIWKISHLGFSAYSGFLNRSAIDATVELNAQNVASSTLDVTIDGQQIETLHAREADPRNVDFDAEVESDMFLNTAAIPEITFTTTAIAVTGENTADITGELSFNGATHPLTLATTLNRAANHPVTGAPTFGISAIGVVQRSQYGVATLLGPIGDEVTLEIQAEFIKQD